MDYLWSPWRMKYILNNEDAGVCVFCEAVQAQDGPQNLVIARGKLSYVIMNRFPYTNGHLMVAPYAHVDMPNKRFPYTSGHVMVVPYEHQPSFEQLTPQCRAELMELITQAMGVIRSVYGPEGFNVGANIGEAAGAGIAAHVHFHVVPRWGGDTNFMSTLAGTRVLPESLEDTYQRLKAGWK